MCHERRENNGNNEAMTDSHVNHLGPTDDGVHDGVNEGGGMESQLLRSNSGISPPISPMPTIIWTLQSRSCWLLCLTSHLLLLWQRCWLSSIFSDLILLHPNPLMIHLQFLISKQSIFFLHQFLRFRRKDGSNT